MTFFLHCMCGEFIDVYIYVSLDRCRDMLIVNCFIFEKVIRMSGISKTACSDNIDIKDIRNDSKFDLLYYN